jgi:hypothetical protein
LSMLTGHITKRLSLALAATMFTALVGLVVAPTASYASASGADAVAANTAADEAAEDAEIENANRNMVVGKPCRLKGTQVRNSKRISDQTTFPSGGRWSVEGDGGITLTLSFATAIANSVSGTLGASKGAISASVGFSVTKTTTVTVSGSYPTPKGNGTYELYAGYTEHVTQFEVWKKWGTVAHGVAPYCSTKKAKYKKAGTEYAFQYTGHIVFGHVRLS